MAAKNGYAIQMIVAAWLATATQGRPMLPTEEITEQLARGIFTANELSMAVADEAITDLANLHADEVIPRIGIQPEPEELDRLRRAVDVIFEADHEQLVSRMERIATSEPLRAAKVAMQEAMRLRGVEEWVRVVQPKACDACADRLGEVREIDTPFTDHPGCKCSLRARIPQGWGDTVKERALQLRQVAPNGIRLSTGISFDSIHEGENHE
ncbi:hypothetical protein [Janibacter melonis]|uniref:hypothetical protein n=1 Tax=Janibacter melonis TaxID=262209 RepID=UPI0019184E52|nr:hypothetical protein [Janibacter melonis]